MLCAKFFLEIFFVLKSRPLYAIFFMGVKNNKSLLPQNFFLGIFRSIFYCMGFLKKFFWKFFELKKRTLILFVYIYIQILYNEKLYKTIA